MKSGKKTIVNGLVSMAKCYGHYYGDANFIANTEDWLYICDTENYDLLMVQENSESTHHECSRDWHGKKCYDYIFGFNSPCSFCPIKNVQHDNYYVWTYDDKEKGRSLFLKNILIDWDHRPAMLQSHIDISSQKRRNEVMNEYIISRNLVMNVLSCLMEEKPVKEIFKSVCQDIGEFFQSDRVLITEYYTGSLNTCWSRIGDGFVQVCTEITGDGRAKLTKATENLRSIWIPDVENAAHLADDIKEYWLSCGIRSMLMIPMHYNGEFVGTLSLHNISSHYSEIDTLNLIGLSVVKILYANMLESLSERQLYTDPLTGVMNLSGLKRKVYEIIKSKPNEKYCFCVFDIRYFGGINRRFSFELGDSILKKTADVFKKQMGEDTVFCRIEADKFCFFKKFRDYESTQRSFQKFVNKMQCFEELSAINLPIDYQAGMYVTDKAGECSISQAIDKANSARSTLKDYHSSKLAFFNEDMLEQHKHEVELIQDFKSALADNEITVYYQPQCRYTQNKLAGAEALVRWYSPKHGFVSPSEFIPLLERNGLIYDLDRYVWELVCKHQRKWLDKGYCCPVSVNVSRYDVLRNGICEELCSLLDKYGIPKKMFPLEITETAYIKSSSELINVVDMLKEAGFTVEMDDFGSGYSSLNALKDVSVDMLKLDMKFLDMNGINGKGGSILNCIVRMTRWLNMPVLAEGVETKDQAEYLKNIGCDLMQGYYFAKPMPADEFEAVLEKYRNSTDGNDDAVQISTGMFLESVVSNPMLFNHMGAAAIVEYYNGECEALLVNDSFFKMIGCSRDEYNPYMKHMFAYSSDKMNCDNAAARFDSVISGAGAYDFTNSGKADLPEKIRLICKKIRSDDDGRSIILITLTDISPIENLNNSI